METAWHQHCAPTNGANPQPENLRIGNHMDDPVFKGKLGEKRTQGMSRGNVDPENWRSGRRNLAPEFGTRVRGLRSAQGYGLREFARKVDISPTYLSQVERGEVPPPAEERVITIAQALGEDPYVLLALAGRIPDRVRKALMRHPSEMTTLVSLAGTLSKERLVELLQKASALVATETGG